MILVTLFLRDTTYNSYYNDVDKNDNCSEWFVIVRPYKRKV